MKVSLALDGWTSLNKLCISLFNAYSIDRNRALQVVPVAFDEVDHVFFSAFESHLRIMNHGSLYWSKASCTVAGCGLSM